MLSRALFQSLCAAGRECLLLRLLQLRNLSLLRLRDVAPVLRGLCAPAAVAGAAERFKAVAVVCDRAHGSNDYDIQGVKTGARGCTGVSVAIGANGTVEIVGL